MALLIHLKEAPAEASTNRIEKALSVNVIEVQPEEHAVSLKEYGRVESLHVVRVAAEVSGPVLETHPNLIEGGLIPKGETVAGIDPRPYQIQVDDATATVSQLEKSIERLTLEQNRERDRLAALKRARDLAKENFDRLADLIQEEVGTQTEVDAAEKAYVEAGDSVDQLDNTLALYPVRIEEARNQLASAEAKKRMAALELEKTRIVAPFDARVRSYQVERGQFVATGQELCVLANDSVLEIHVPLDSYEAQRWLEFDGGADSDAAWFTSLKPVPCRIKWTEEMNGHVWSGTLHRVVTFDPESHTITVAVRIAGEDAASDSLGQMPLVEGMFCEVAIPGRTLPSVYRIPQESVTLDNAVYVAEGDRLATRDVTVVREDEAFVYVSDGLESGDRVIVTRLVNPLEKSLLSVTVESR